MILRARLSARGIIYTTIHARTNQTAIASHARHRPFPEDNLTKLCCTPTVIHLMGCEMSNVTDNLDKLTERVEAWLATLPSRNENEHPTLNVAKQFLADGCDFAWTISQCVNGDRLAPATANLRPLLDLRLHMWHFLGNPEDQHEWEVWSQAKLSQCIGGMLARQECSESDRSEFKKLMDDMRHWNKPLGARRPRQFSKPGRYQWEDLKDAVLDGCKPHDRNCYEATSMHLHPTYRGSRTPALGSAVDWLLENAVLNLW